MAEFALNYGLFFLKAATIVAAIVIVVLFVVGMSMRQKGGAEGRIEIRKLNDRLKAMKETLTQSLLKPHELKAFFKQLKSEEKATAKSGKKALKKSGGLAEDAFAQKRRVFVLDFNGDIRASALANLRKEITALLTSATSNDEVVVKLESGGGMVTSYGLAASQLDRIRQAKIPLTICVDKIAGSGGYMMACVADKLLAAPFAMLGSIGVVAQIPNIHRLLKEHNVDIELITAGKYKRTLTVLGENTDEGRQKFIQDMERIHKQFKDYVGERRPILDIDAVATGEVWSGHDALDNRLIDGIETSDQYLMAACESSDVLELTYKKRVAIGEKFGLGVQNTLDGLVTRCIDRLMQSRNSI